MTDGAAFVVAALGADMVKLRAIGQIHLHHQIGARSGGPVFQQCQFCPGFNLYAMMQHRIRSL